MQLVRSVNTNICTAYGQESRLSFRNLFSLIRVIGTFEIFMW